MKSTALMPQKTFKIRIKKSTVIDVIAALFILLFVYTALSKITNITQFESVLNRSPLIENKAPLVAWGLPMIEFFVAGLLFIPSTRKLGLYSSLVLMILFTSYIGYMMVFVPTLPCSCGGVLSMMSWKQHLIFNLAFTILAFVSIILGRKKKERT